MVEEDAPGQHHSDQVNVGSPGLAGRGGGGGGGGSLLAVLSDVLVGVLDTHGVHSHTHAHSVGAAHEPRGHHFSRY